MTRTILKPDRKPGISFILRCRNEEKLLAMSIESLKDLSVPYEIVIILHRCTDGSKQVAEKYKKLGYPIRIYEYEQEASRAGYETLVTPGTHQASLVTYYSFCMSKADFNWVFKWDADFTATKELMEKLGQLDLGLKKPTRIYIKCMLDKVAHYESYLFNALLHYKKYVFWEVPIFPDGVKRQYFKGELIKSVPIKVTKGYWLHEPWFLAKETYDAGLAVKYRLVTVIGGRERVGMARASNPELRKPFFAIMKNKKLLKKAGIYITR